MSAAEKLKALEYKWNADAYLKDALPQIVAVVEAAERQATLEDERRRGPMLRQELIPALSALDEALS